MNVEKIMTQAVATCAPDSSMAEAARLMREKKCGILPVVEGPGRRMTGVVTDRDLCMTACTGHVPMGDLPVKHAMTHKVYYCRPETDLRTVHARLRHHRVRRLPVIDEADRLVGIISLDDLAAHAVAVQGGPGREEQHEVVQTLAMVSAT